MILRIAFLAIGLGSVGVSAFTTQYIPAAANGAGANGTFWLTDARVFNPHQSRTITVELSLLPPGTDNTAAPVVTRQIGPRQAARLDDILASTLGTSGIGAIKITSFGDFLGSSRTYNTGGGTGTYGQFIPAFDESLALESGILLQLLNRTGGGGFRSNVGFVNPNSTSVNIEYALFDTSTGAQIGTGSIALQPFGFAQINNIFQSAGIDSTFENVSLEFSATLGVFAYASVIDNDSGDAIYVSPFEDDGTQSGGNSAPNGTITSPAGDVTIEVANEVFFAGSASDPDGDTIFVEWVFSDGGTSSALVPGSHVFATEGTFTVSLTATDEHGLADPTPASVVVTVTASGTTPDSDLGALFEEIGIEPHIHDPSRIIEVDGWRMVAVTGKAQEDGYHCGLETWFQEPGSDTWTPGQCILRDKPHWVAEELPGNDGAYWAPALVDANTIIYSVSAFEDEGACIGLARATGQIPEQTWRDVGEPLTCTLNDSLDALDRPHSIDPAYLEDADGTPYLVYGGENIWLAELDPDTLLIKDGTWWEGATDVHHHLASGPDEPDENGNDWIEAPFLYEREGSYYLFVNWYACCAGTGSTYEIRVGRAISPTGPFFDRDAVDMRVGGGTQVLDRAGEALGDPRFIGPGHAGIHEEDGQIHMTFHFYDGEREGLPWMGSVPLRFEDGWPVVDGPGRLE